MARDGEGVVESFRCRVAPSSLTARMRTLRRVISVASAAAPRPAAAVLQAHSSRHATAALLSPSDTGRSACHAYGRATRSLRTVGRLGACVRSGDYGRATRSLRTLGRLWLRLLVVDGASGGGR